MTGKSILHYRIIEKLGEGGMGVVYLAEDTKLERQVAIKFLPHHISANSDERKRFEIEAKAAAALNHPNIATIYSIEEADEELFLVMEYISGKNLKDYLKDRKLTWQESLKIALQLSQALKTAHKNGIVHRDVKTANIMSNEDDVIKIMDFGLAKFRGSAQLTQIGTTIGTAAYMSPEQARGEDADKRSDIWSFGVVLYEMLTGQLPFKGEYEQAVMYAMLNEEAESISKLNSDVPQALVSIVEKCLQKKLENRYQDVGEIINDLESVHSGTTSAVSSIKPMASQNQSKRKMSLIYFLFVFAVLVSVIIYMRDDTADPVPDTIVNRQEIKKLAILPFSNLKPDPETDYLGYALADQIIGAMSYVKNIAVRPSSAIRKYQGQTIDIASVGTDLSVNYILTGNYLKQGDLVRLNVELVNSKDNELLWRDVIDEKFENTFRLQDLLTEKIINGLKIQFSSDEKELANADVPNNPLAYEYFLRAVALPGTEGNNKLSIELLNKSLELDSSYAPAWGVLGWRYHRLAAYSLDGKQYRSKAIENYKKSLELNPNLTRTLGSLAVLYTELNQKEKALEISRKILEINPNNPDAHFLLSYIYRYAGMIDEAKKEAEKAVKINPDPAYRSGGHVFAVSGEYDKALKFYALDKGSAFYYSNFGYIYLAKGDTIKAREYFNKLLEVESNTANSYFTRALLAYMDNDKEKGFKYLQSVEDENFTDGEMWYGIAQEYGILNKPDKVVKSLEKAVSLGYFNYNGMLIDKAFDNIRDDEAFKNILTKAKAKHEAFKKKYFSEKTEQLP